jgi:nitrogen-specific signal transduction histidine kinase
MHSSKQQSRLVAVVQAHGGTLEWQPAEQDTIFVVLLPRAG